MNAAQRILKAVREVFGNGYGPETIYKGQEFDDYGWQFRKFDETATFLGSSAREALETLSQIKAEREQVAEDWKRSGGDRQP